MPELISRPLRRRLAAAVAAGAAIALLAACSSSGDSTAGGASGTPAKSFTMMAPSTGQGESPYQAIAKQYQQATGVRIDVTMLPADSYDQTVRTELQAGTAPDLITVTPGSQLPTSVKTLANASFLAPITNPSVKQTILRGTDNLFGTNGKIYAEPTGVSAFALIYNERGAQAAGGTFPATWQNLLAGCTKTGGKPAFLAIGGSVADNTAVLGIELAGGLVYAKDPGWNAQRTAGTVTFANSQGWKQVLQAVVDMNKAKCFQPGAAGDGLNQTLGDLMQGKATSIALPSLLIGQFEAANPALKLEVQVIPSSGSVDRFLIAGQNSAFGINAHSDASHQAAAAAFLNWLAQPKSNVQMASDEGTIPVADLSGNSKIPAAFAPVAGLITSGKFTYLPSYDWSGDSVYNALGTGIQSLLTGQGSIQSVLQSMDQAWNQ